MLFAWTAQADIVKMNSSLKIGLAAGLVFAAALASAAPASRQFAYKSGDLVDQDFSVSGTVELKARTKITVNPYLYITGNLGAEWVVDGWGSGEDTQTESIKFFHNETLTLDFEDFANPKKVSGTQTGAQVVQLSARMSFVNDDNGKGLFDTDFVPAPRLNSIFDPSGPNFEVSGSGGVLRLDFTRRIQISPEVGPGVYENVGIIKVIRN